jgi:3-oxoacyl-[acyl-carrier protein] reductase
MTLKGRVALVTGSGRGIGNAIAAVFAREKAHVVLNDIHSQNELARVADDISTGEIQILPIHADVSKFGEAREMIARVEEPFQRLDFLVNNAGIISLTS